MQYLEHHIDAFLAVFRDGFEDLSTWSNTIFRGMELPVFGSLIGNLAMTRGVSPGAIREAILEDLSALPWQGCEFVLMNSLITALRSRGHSDVKIAAIARAIAAYAVDLQERVDGTYTEPFERSLVTDAYSAEPGISIVEEDTLVPGIRYH